MPERAARYLAEEDRDFFSLIRGLGVAPRTRWAIAEIAKRIIATKKMIFAIETAVPAIPPKPRMAAMQRDDQERQGPSEHSVSPWLARSCDASTRGSARRVPCGGGIQVEGPEGLASGRGRPTIPGNPSGGGTPCRCPIPIPPSWRARPRSCGGCRPSCAGDAVIHDPAEVARLRVRRADRLSLPAAGGGAAGLDGGGGGGARGSATPRGCRWCRAGRGPASPAGRCRRRTACSSGWRG